MIIDVFQFDNEFDILECRLTELGGVVDLFVACEGNHTFSGIPKPYHLTEALESGDYKGFPLSVFRADTTGDTWEAFQRSWILPETAKFWWREKVQRQAANDFLRGLPLDTVVLGGDLDEIPRRNVVEGFDGIASSLVMAHLVYSTAQQTPGPWIGTVMGTLGQLGPDAHFIRERRGAHRPIYDAGWHFSWFGGGKRRESKYTRQAHQELRAEGKLESEYPASMTHVDGHTKLIPYEGDLPRWVIDKAPPEWTEKLW